MVCFTIHEASLWERRFLVSRYMRRTFHRYGIVRQAENKSALGVIYTMYKPARMSVLGDP